MLRILLGEDQNSVSSAILEQICRNAADGKSGQILMVPEQYSHDMERTLCAVGGDSICLSAEVLSFSRLASRVCSLYGGVSRRNLDHGGRLVAMSLAMESVGSRLKLYGVSRKKPEFLLRILAALDEFKSACISAEQIRRASAGAGGQLAVKLEELALIAESFDAVCAAMGQDSHDRLSLLCDQLDCSGYAAGRQVFILGFSDFTGRELEIISRLLEHAEGVTVGILGDGSDRGCFALGAKTVQRLKSLAARQGADAAVEALPEPGGISPELSYLRRHLFSGSSDCWPQKPEALALHHSAGIYGACMETAGRIQRLAMAGWRYRDLAVCCTGDLYRPVLESVFRRFSIPAYFAGVEVMEEDPVVGMIQSALDAATGGLEAEDVLRFLKSGLSPLQPSECDLLENYAGVWRIRGRKWETEWDMHPDGYGAPLDAAAKERLLQLNDARVRGVQPLAQLRDGLRAASGTAEQVEALYAFLERIGLAQTLERLQERSTTRSELQQAQAYGQMYEIVLQALEQMYLVLGETVRDPGDFADLFSVVLSQYDVGTIPANLDSVRVGDASSMRFGQCRALFLLGAEEGEFPACRPDGGLFSEQERKRLAGMGLAVMPGQSVQLNRELAILYQVLTSASEQLFVCSSTDQPAYLFTRMRELFPLAPLGEDAEIPEILCSSPEAVGALLAAGQMLPEDAAEPEVQRTAQEIRTLAGHRPGALTGGVEALYGRKLYLSASRIDQYAACRCAYFLRYGLKLRKQKEAAFDAPVYGTFVHFVLEETARQVRKEGGFHAVDEARLMDIARETISAYEDDTLSLMMERSERLAYLFQRNQGEVLEVVRELGRELRHSDFEPAGFELEFSETGQMGPVEIQGRHAAAELSGFVDRVDLYTHQGITYVRVVDYKTGKKAFDYTDVLNGIGLQMLIYLFALEEHGEEAFGTPLRPAGVLYFPARRIILPAAGRLEPEEAERKRRGELSRQGVISEDTAVLQAMERFEDRPVYMPYQVNSRGELTGDLADAEEMRLLKQHVSRVLSQMADSIAEGTVDPNPIVRGAEDSACTYCEYAEICHRASGELAMRPMRKTDRKKFWEILRKEGAGHG